MSEPVGPWSRLPPPPPQRRRSVWPWLILLACLAVLIWALIVLNPTQTLSGEEWGSIAYALLFLALVSTSLFSRRLRLGQAVRYALAWLAIVAAALLGYTFRDELSLVARRMTGELAPDQPQATGAQEMTVTRAEDGHFYVMGAVNGAPVRFMVDTGASGVVLDPSDARRIGIDVAALTFGERFSTANGIGRGAPVVADSLTIGPVRLTGMRVWVNEAPMGVGLLGQDFLQRLASFEVRGNQLKMRW